MNRRLNIDGTNAKSNINVPIRPFAFSYRSFESIYVIESVPKLLVSSYSAPPLSAPLITLVLQPKLIDLLLLGFKHI